MDASLDTFCEKSFSLWTKKRKCGWGCSFAGDYRTIISMRVKRQLCGCYPLNAGKFTYMYIVDLASELISYITRLIYTVQAFSWIRSWRLPLYARYVTLCYSWSQRTLDMPVQIAYFTSQYGHLPDYFAILAVQARTHVRQNWLCLSIFHS